MGAGMGISEIEPLAYRVRSLAGECFESWLERLAARHETTRKALFGYLGIERALAARDLASSADGAAERHRIMVERLAWATALPEKAVLRTFVGCPRGDLLPPALRSIGCPQCWLDWLESGAPWRIERSWILRVTLRCERHDLLLTDLRSIMSLGRSMTAQRLLEETVDRTREQMARFTLVSTRLAWNLVISRAHLRGSEPSSYAFSRRYMAALIGNRFHFAPSRHLLLAALHSSNLAEAERVDRMFRFDAQPACGPARRAPRGSVPGVADLAAAITTVGLRQLGRKRHVLEVAGQQLEQAGRNYPAVHAAQMLRRQRAVLASEVRRRYAAEFVSAAKSPLTCLRGFQDALFYLKQCGMADDSVVPATGRPDPWEDCLGNPRLLHKRLTRRFADPAFRVVLDLPGHAFADDAFERASSRSMSAMASSNSARLSAESTGDRSGPGSVSRPLPSARHARIRT